MYGALGKCKVGGTERKEKAITRAKTKLSHRKLYCIKKVGS